MLKLRKWNPEISSCGCSAEFLFAIFLLQAKEISYTSLLNLNNLIIQVDTSDGSPSAHDEGENDSEDEMRNIARWISQLRDGSGAVTGQDIPLHISRFFPRFRMTDRRATDVSLIYRLADIAREDLNFVYTGNC